MIPITRKEHYLNRIVGNNDYDIPEKPITTEEFFFAEILGEAVQAPEPLPRYQIYLAKIAGRNIEIPYPETRLEYFLAKACGMDIEIPTPITREEIFWSNYSAIADFEVEGVPPLTYKAIEGTLENYRIYGNTVDGESVGDLVESGEHAGEYKVPVTVEGKNLLQNTATSQTIKGVTFTVNSDGSVTCNGTASATASILLQAQITLNSGSYILTGCPQGGEANTNYKLDIIDPIASVAVAIDTGSGASLTLRQNMQARIVIYTGQVCDNLTFYPMIRKADIEDDTYEPYHAPVTTPIYLPKPIKMIGEEAEYIDYTEQKLHRVRENYLQSSDFEAGAIITGQLGKNLTYQDSKTPPGMADIAGVVFDTTRKRFTGLITIIGTYTISIADGWEFGIVMFPNDKNSGEQFIYNTEPVTISNCTFAIQLKKTDTSDIRSANISDYKIMLNKGTAPLPYEPYIEDTELDVTLPALPNLTGTNVLSVGTAVQPSKVYIKGQKEREYS